MFGVFKTAWLCLSARVPGVSATVSVGPGLGDAAVTCVLLVCQASCDMVINSLAVYFARQVATSSSLTVCRALGVLAASCSETFPRDATFEHHCSFLGE